MSTSLAMFLMWFFWSLFGFLTVESFRQWRKSKDWREKKNCMVASICFVALTIGISAHYFLICPFSK